MADSSFRKTVLLIGRPSDPHLTALKQALQDRAVRVLHVDNRKQVQVSLRPEAPLSSTIQGVEGTWCAGVYVRALPPRQFPNPAQRDRQALSRKDALAETRAGQALRDPLCAILEVWANQGVTVLNPPRAGEMIENKPLQLMTASEIGLDIPKTLITADMKDLSDWYTSELSPQTSLISKPVRGGDYTQTFPMPPQKEPPSSSSIYQEFVTGQHIRVLMLNGDVISAHGLVGVGGADHRADPNYQSGSFSYEHVAPPEILVTHLKQLQRRLDLPFCGFDLIAEDHGNHKRWVFLEANGAPIYLESETRLGHPLTERLAATLVGEATMP